jgi:hypothetical protein
VVHRASLLLTFTFLAGCAGTHEFHEEYLANVSPDFLVEDKIVVLMHDHDQQFVFTGKPTSQIGETITLTMPIGAILREVAADVLRSYFMYGVVFTDRLDPALRYTVAIEPEVRDFSYRYDRTVEGNVFDTDEQGGGLEPVSVITPSIEFRLDVAVHDSTGNVIMRKSYPSGVVQGESYIVTSRPHERVNALFHRTLQELMVKVADDVRPLLAANEGG